MAEDIPINLSVEKQLIEQFFQHSTKCNDKSNGGRTILFEPTKMQIKMKSDDISDPTLCNRYPNEDQEYVFCYKGRPFGCLISPHIPTPSATLVDYNLVKDLGMKMYDLQYQKFSYCGF